MGLYKCSSDPDADSPCPCATSRSIDPSDLSESNRRELGHGEALEAMTSAPTCPECGEACLPQALLFDEDYSDHGFYQFEKLQEWFDEAQAFVFVGTSMAVTLTSLAQEEARDKKVKVFNFNIDDEPERAATRTLKWHDVCGPAEETLPRLVDAVKALTRKTVDPKQCAEN